MTFKPGVQSQVFPNYLPGWLFKNTITGQTDPGWTRSGYNAPQEWDPRVGFAYDVRGNGRTAIRGGFGLFGGGGRNDRMAERKSVCNAIAKLLQRQSGIGTN